MEVINWKENKEVGPIFWDEDSNEKTKNIYRIFLGTLYNVILRIARNFLETRKNIKIRTYPFYHTNSDWFL